MYKGGKYNRRERAKKRLEEQLERGTKVVNTIKLEDISGKAVPVIATIPLEEKDIKRIKGEITTLSK